MGKIGEGGLKLMCQLIIWVYAIHPITSKYGKKSVIKACTFLHTDEIYKHIILVHKVSSF